MENNFDVMTPVPESIEAIHSILGTLLCQLHNNAPITQDIHDLTIESLYDDSFGQILRRMASYVDHDAAWDDATGRLAVDHVLYDLFILALTTQTYQAFWQTSGGHLITRLIRWGSHTAITDDDIHQRAEMYIARRRARGDYETLYLLSGCMKLLIRDVDYSLEIYGPITSNDDF